MKVLTSGLQCCKILHVWLFLSFIIVQHSFSQSFGPTSTTHIQVQNATEFSFYLNTPHTVNDVTTLVIEFTCSVSINFSSVFLAMNGTGLNELGVAIGTEPSYVLTTKNISIGLESSNSFSINFSYDVGISGGEDWKFAIKSIPSTCTQVDVNIINGSIGTFTDAYLPPQINSGTTPEVVNEGATIAMGGGFVSGTSDSDFHVVIPPATGVSITFQWNAVDDPDGSLHHLDDLADPTDPNTNYAAPTGLTTDEDRHFSLIASAGLLAVTSAIKTITIQVIREPIEVMLVIDRSGSMNTAGKWDAALNSAELFMRTLRAFKTEFTSSESDKAGIVTFSWINPSTDNTVVESGWNLQDVNTTVFAEIPADFATRGRLPLNSYYTPIGQGLAKAVEEFVNFILTYPSLVDEKKIILLLTDGKHNRGPDPVAGTSYRGPRPLAWYYANIKSSIGTQIHPSSSIANMNIYTVGLGRDSNIEPEEISDLALVSGGDYRLTDDNLVLAHFFLQIVGSLVEGHIEEELVPPVDPNTYNIGVDVSKAVFIFIWAFDDTNPHYFGFNLLGSPGTLTPTSPGTDNEFFLGKGHAFYIINSGFSSTAPNWRMLDFREIDATTFTDVGGISILPLENEKTVLTLPTSTLVTRFTIDREKHETGGRIILRAFMKEYGIPVTGAAVTARLVTPEEGVGEILSNSPSPTRNDTTNVDRDPQKFSHLQDALENMGRDTLIVDSDLITLLDDGTGEDLYTNDGIYTSVYTETDFEGTYTFKFQASGTAPTGGYQFSRTKTISDFVRVGVDPDETTILTQSLPPDQFDIPSGWLVISVAVTPLDKFGRHLGPYHPQDIGFVLSDEMSVRRYRRLTDNLNGTYTQIFAYDPTANPVIQVKVQDKIMLTTVKPPGLAGPFTITPFVGYFFFDDTLGIDDGVVFGVRAAYRAFGNFTVEGELGITPTEDALNKKGVVIQATGNLNYEFSGNPAQKAIPFVTAGVGIVRFQNFTVEDQAVVYNFGAGLKYNLNKRLAISLQGCDYVISSSDLSLETTHNLQATLGLMISF